MPGPTEALRRLYLTLFLRGRTARGIRRQTVPQSVGRKLAGTLFIYGLFGLLALNFVGQPVFALSVYLHASTFLFLGMFVAASAGEILFHREEADILMHRPIEPRALLWAKVRVLVEVSLWIAAAFNLAGMCVGLMTGGWRFPLVHAASTVLEALFCTGCVVLSYQLCLRWFGRERLNGLMTTAQVIVSVAAVLAGQILPRLTFRVGRLVDFQGQSWWVALLPPAWFAGMDDALAGTASPAAWALGGAAVIATAAVLASAFGRLARDYVSGLQVMAETSVPRSPTTVRRRWLGSLANRPPLSWLLRHPVSRASFLLTAAYLARDRDTKLRFYPGVAPMLAVPMLILLGGSRHAASGSDLFGLAAAGAFLGVVPLVGLSVLQYSDQWQASDVFRLAPVQGPDPVCHGARQAILWLVAVPGLLAFTAVTWLVRRDMSQLQLLLPGAIALPIYCLWPHFGGRGVPFSQASETSRSASRGLTMIGAMLSSIAISSCSLLARSHGLFSWFIAAECVIVTGLYLGLRSVLRRTDWLSIE